MKVELTGIELFARHGCLLAERESGNTFRVDVSFEYDASAAARTDSLESAVDYGAVYGIVQQQMAVPSNLLENVAWRIRAEILAQFPQLTAVSVKVSKKNPPVGGPCEWSSVTAD